MISAKLSEMGYSCPICYENYKTEIHKHKPVKLTCKNVHTVCLKCFDNYRQKKLETCPVCRDPISFKKKPVINRDIMNAVENVKRLLIENGKHEDSNDEVVRPEETDDQKSSTSEESDESSDLEDSSQQTSNVEKGHQEDKFVIEEDHQECSKEESYVTSDSDDSYREHTVLGESLQVKSCIETRPNNNANIEASNLQRNVDRRRDYVVMSPQAKAYLLVTCIAGIFVTSIVSGATMWGVCSNSEEERCIQIKTAGQVITGICISIFALAFCCAKVIQP